MKFKKEFLQELTEYEPEGEGPVVESQMIAHLRWHLKYRMVFKHEGKFYSSTYLIGATEYQDDMPYEYDDEEIECKEVFPVSKTITVYEEDIG